MDGSYKTTTPRRGCVVEDELKHKNLAVFPWQCS